MGRGFNEAPAKSGGERARRPVILVLIDASMRPPRKAGGNEIAAVAGERQSVASMRPPRKTGGNAAGSVPTPGASGPCFNEAPAKSGGGIANTAACWSKYKWVGFNDAPAKSGGEPSGLLDSTWGLIF